jgi:hapalindole-type alkaloid chlorinase
MTAMAATSRPCQVTEADGCGELSAAILEIHEGVLDGVILRHVFPAELVAGAAARIERGETGLPVFQPPDGRKGLVYGVPLVSTDGSLPHYLDMAELFRTECAALFGPDEPERPLVAAIGAFAGGCAVSVPRAEDGRPYLPATIRFLAAGDLLPLHYENEVFGWAGMRNLAPKLDRSTLMSFYVPMVLSDRGGELRLYRSTCLDGGSARIGELGGDEAARPHLEREGYEILRPGPGDLLVFDGGRRYHEVTRIEGRTRWTMGGVLALSRDHASIHFWS